MKDEDEFSRKKVGQPDILGNKYKGMTERGWLRKHPFLDTVCHLLPLIPS